MPHDQRHQVIRALRQRSLQRLRAAQQYDSRDSPQHTHGWHHLQHGGTQLKGCHLTSHRLRAWGNNLG